MKVNARRLTGEILPLAAASLVLLLISQPAMAEIVSITGTTFSDLPVGSVGGGGGYQVLATSWVSTKSYTNVDISAVLHTETYSGNSTGTSTGIAYLMTEIGAGATSADQVASASFSVLDTFTTPTKVSLFSGLSLGPGTYYLVLGNPGLSPRFYWVTASPATVGVAIGATALSDYTTNSGATYEPRSLFVASERSDRLEFTVVGDEVSTVPEPASVLSLIGMVLVLGINRLISPRNPGSAHR